MERAYLPRRCLFTPCLSKDNQALSLKGSVESKALQFSSTENAREKLSMGAVGEFLTPCLSSAYNENNAPHRHS